MAFAVSAAVTFNPYDGAIHAFLQIVHHQDRIINRFSIPHIIFYEQHARISADDVNAVAFT